MATWRYEDAGSLPGTSSNQSGMYVGRWGAQTFSPSENWQPGYGEGGYELTLVSLSLTRFTGAPTVGNFTISIQGTVGGVPDGVDLDSITIPCISISRNFHWEHFSLSVPVLYADVTYAIVAKSTAPLYSNAIGWWFDTRALYAYPRGTRLYSDDGGGTWVDYGDDFVFRIWGVPWSANVPRTYFFLA